MEVECVDCSKTYSGSPSELPTRCEECQGPLRPPDGFENFEGKETNTDKI